MKGCSEYALSPVTDPVAVLLWWVLLFVTGENDCLSRWVLSVLQFDKPFLLSHCLALNCTCVNCQLCAFWEGPAVKSGKMDIWEGKDESLFERDRHGWKTVVCFPKPCAASVFCMSCQVCQKMIGLKPQGNCKKSRRWRKPTHTEEGEKLNRSQPDIPPPRKCRAPSPPAGTWPWEPTLLFPRGEKEPPDGRSSGEDGARVKENSSEKDWKLATFAAL